MSLAQSFLPAVPRVALWLGAAGLAPFYAAVLVVWASADPVILGTALYGQIAYAAVIAAFLGAVHWGLAMSHMETAGPTPPLVRQIVFSVVPAVAAWLAMLLKPALALGALLVLFPAIFVRDQAAVRAGLAPAWYPSLRLPLTVLVMVALAASLLRVLTVDPA